jgi:hypothetical protein
MIDIAARSTHGVVIPNHKGTRAHIIKLFKQNHSNLRDRLTVSAYLYGLPGWVPNPEEIEVGFRGFLRFRKPPNLKLVKPLPIRMVLYSQ